MVNCLCRFNFLVLVIVLVVHKKICWFSYLFQFFLVLDLVLVNYSVVF